MDGAPLMDLEEAWIFRIWTKRLLIFEDRIEARDFELANLMVPILERKEVMRANTDMERSRDER